MTIQLALKAYIPTYLPTYLHTYIHAYLHTYIPTYIHIQVLSVIGQQIMTIQLALKAGVKRIDFEGSNIAVQMGFGVFITMNPGTYLPTYLPRSAFISHSTFCWPISIYLCTYIYTHLQAMLVVVNYLILSKPYSAL